ncbi:hypothetical protein DFH08DRAFT_969998 [Mycena albidolilacea]|uniref:C2H2-type domain-containing protein n=1 Tax=Mycena albidolilacea TaxID=1033008 RepID=A0AAD6ZGD5_9AGAR|nr:hypothetical protein DFH08DRAFT_969998 [Mycena albidolilacea]
MLLSVAIEDLLASELEIKLGHVDGRLSCDFKPNVNHKRDSPTHQASSGGIINIRSVWGEHGYVLGLYASPTETSIPVADTFAPIAANNAQENHFGTIAVNMDYDDPLIFPGSSPLHSDYPAASTLSSAVASPQFHAELPNDWELEFATSCMSAGMNDNVDLDHQFSELFLPTPSSTPPSSDHSSFPANTLSNPSLSHANFITCVSPPTPAPSTSPTPPADTASGKSARRGQYPCLHPPCSRILTIPYTRQVHMGTHTAKPRKAFTCTLGCGEVFTRQHDRHRHEVALHGKQCAHVCARCKRFFATEKMLGRHVCRGYRQSGIQWPLGDNKGDGTNSAPVTPVSTLE